MPRDSTPPASPATGPDDVAALPPVVDRAARPAQLDALPARETAPTREGDAIAAGRSDNGADISGDRRRGLSRRRRNAFLVAHIAASVAILGDSAAFLAISIRARTLPAAEAHASYEILGMLSVVFGIPLSFLALGTGVALGLGTRWGVFGYPWVITKLALLVSVLVVGGAVLGPAESAALDGTGGTGMLIAGATWDIVALTVAIGLSVYKPGRALRPVRPAPADRSVRAS